MNERFITCIRCPVGCRLNVVETDGKILVSGQSCARGLEYGAQEYLSPMRTVTSSVRVRGGIRPVGAVKTEGDIPKSKVADVLEAIHGMAVHAPLVIGQVLAEDIAKTGVRLVATASIAAK